MEEWRDIKGYEGLYQVSDQGRVRSLDRRVRRGDGFQILKGRLLKNDNTDRYARVTLCGESKKTIRVHQLVAATFIDTEYKEKGLVVDHINNNPLDNRVENLQVITVRKNLSKDKFGFSSKYIGVHWDSWNKKWRAVITIDGKHHRLGRFDCELEAAKAYQNKLKELELC